MSEPTQDEVTQELPPRLPERRERRADDTVERRGSAYAALANAAFTVPATTILVWWMNNFILPGHYDFAGNQIQIGGELGAAFGAVLAVLFAILADEFRRWRRIQNRKYNLPEED